MQTPAADQILTPSQLNTLARGLLEDSFPLLWIEAELGNVARPASGHLYFNLKDARAQVRAAMFRGRAASLRFAPREGQKVLARGKLTLYEPRGDYQIIIEQMEEAGEGALRRAFEALKALLQAEGLFAAERKRPLPFLPRRIAVLTSPSGAVIRDICSVLSRRFPLLELELLPIPVQGEGAAAHITQMLQRAHASGRYDLLLLARGGGSLEDLWAFNDEQLARAIAASPIPVVSAIGHETDFTLADFAADLRAPTPSAAAELIAPDQQAIAQRLDRARQQLQAKAQHQLRQSMQQLDHARLRLEAASPSTQLQFARLRQQQLWQRLRSALSQRLQTALQRTTQAVRALKAHAPERRLALLATRQQAVGHRLQQAWQHSWQRAQQRCQSAGQRLQQQHPGARLQYCQQRLAQLAPRPQAAIAQQLRLQQQQLQGLARALHAISPLATLGRGYSILHSADGRVLRSVHAVQPGDALNARLADGTLQLQVTARTPLEAS
ncbi:exodeoxyribonuclease VII large subunit [Lysobacteraceae bacterium NML75-0749]|nr:exodeoxyribonuclease VII large subunit [Xanthomonadaceae bacterium NML75-0749]PJK05487.1 exodeoxyribonuclease VII large subunit [Xanthomonadaceae bacterium NML91-0268]